jgi:hypothetical protein
LQPVARTPVVLWNAAHGVSRSARTSLPLADAEVHDLTRPPGPMAPMTVDRDPHRTCISEYDVEAVAAEAQFPVPGHDLTDKQISVRGANLDVALRIESPQRQRCRRALSWSMRRPVHDEVQCRGRVRPRGRGSQDRGMRAGCSSEPRWRYVRCGGHRYNRRIRGRAVIHVQADEDSCRDDHRNAAQGGNHGVGCRRRPAVASVMAWLATARAPGLAVPACHLAIIPAMLAVAAPTFRSMRVNSRAPCRPR